MRREVKTWFQVPDGLSPETHLQATCVARAGAFLVAATLVRVPYMPIIDVMRETSLSRNAVLYHARFLEKAGLVRRLNRGLASLGAIDRTHLLRVLRTVHPDFQPADEASWSRLRTELQASLRPFRIGVPRGK